MEVFHHDCLGQIFDHSGQYGILMYLLTQKRGAEKVYRKGMQNRGAERTQMKKEFTIHASSVKELYYYAIQQGAPEKQLNAMTGLQTAHFDNLDARIPVQKIVALWHAAVKLTENTALGLQLGASSQPDDAGIISLVCMNSPTLGEMFSRVIRYMRLVAESDRLELAEKNDTIQLIYQIEAPECFTTYAIERSFAMALNWSSAFTGREIKPVEIHFQYRAPDHLSEYKKVFACPLLFEQHHNAVVLSRSQFMLPAKTYNSYLDELVQRQAESLLQELEADDGLTQQIQKLIIRHLPTGRLNVDVVSENMNMSRRTLARKLREKGTTFQDLVEKTKKELAVDYLKQNKLSVNDIAYMLGFSESSAFSRAFKRWFGDNPQGYRNAFI